MNLKYASELGKEGTLSIANWRPISHEKFLESLHGFTVEYADDHGHDGIKHVTAMRSDRHSTVSIYYVPKNGRHDSPVYTPVLLIMHTKYPDKPSKILCFEFISYDETGHR